ncbi:hypothetical protein LY78DRAFT_658847 [Colletotrichum sublineola]|nr:hypothetical protein LY78DRAFT_658847 [Colletotrichum sublineola]
MSLARTASIRSALRVSARRTIRSQYRPQLAQRTYASQNGAKPQSELPLAIGSLTVFLAGIAVIQPWNSPSPKSHSGHAGHEEKNEEAEKESKEEPEEEEKKDEKSEKSEDKPKEKEEKKPESKEKAKEDSKEDSKPEKEESSDDEPREESNDDKKSGDDSKQESKSDSKNEKSDNKENSAGMIATGFPLPPNALSLLGAEVIAPTNHVTMYIKTTLGVSPFPNA